MGEGAKTKEKSLNDQIRVVTQEKDKLQDKIDELEDTVKKNERSVAKLQAELNSTKSDLSDKDKQCKSMQKDDSKSKALSDRISVLEKQKYEIDTKTRELETEKSSLTFKVSQLEKDKDSLNKKIKDLETAKEDLSKKIQNASSSTAAASNDKNDKKSKEDVSKLQQENKGLKKEKDDLGKTLKAIEKDLKKNIKDVKPNKVQGELKKLAEKIENNSLLSGSAEHLPNGIEGVTSEETNAIKSNFDALQKDFESRTGEIEKLTSQLSRAKADSNSAVEKLRKSESELSQIKEKNAQLSDELLNKSRLIAGMENEGSGNAKELQRQVEDLKKKLSDAQTGKVKKSVKFSTEPEVQQMPNKSVAELEEALEAAYRERKEIIETCRKEAEFHRTIASELENSIMEDFEWKLHEMEKDYNAKLKYSKETVDEQIKEACRGILREKDDEINKLGIKLRKDMDEKLKKEKDELAAALASVRGGSSEAVIEVVKKEKEAELASKQKKWEERNRITSKLNSDIDSMKTEITKKENTISKLEKEKREISTNQDKSQKKINEIESEMSKLKEVLSRLEAEKKNNNFGKYEREKMKLEIDNLVKEKTTVAGRLEDLNKEKHELNVKLRNYLNW